MLVLAVSFGVGPSAPAGSDSGGGGLGLAWAASEFDVHIDAAASRHGVSAELVRAVIEAESGFDRRVVSASGAAGLMQLMPATARRFGVTDSLDARQNISGGTRYLRLLLDTYYGDVSLSAAAYNAGEGAVARHGGIPPYPATRAYVRRVNALLGSRRSRVSVEVAPAHAATSPRGPAPAPCSPLDLLARLAWPWLQRCLRAAPAGPDGAIYNPPSSTLALDVSRSRGTGVAQVRLATNVLVKH